MQVPNAGSAGKIVRRSGEVVHDWRQLHDQADSSLCHASIALISRSGGGGGGGGGGNPQDPNASGTMQIFQSYGGRQTMDDTQSGRHGCPVLLFTTMPEANCRQYGRLYPWEAARRACESLGAGWRLPTEGEWRQLAKQYGGVREDSDDNGKAAYQALLTGGSSGFAAMLGGGRAQDGEYARLEAHGFYWTASQNDPATACFCNFGKGGRALNRQSEGEKPSATLFDVSGSDG